MREMPGSSRARPRPTASARRRPSGVNARSASRPLRARSSAAACRSSHRSICAVYADAASTYALRVHLSPGEQVGPYEIVAPLGKGGMGEVYRARDSRLRREVALKLVSEAESNDDESLRRFMRETHVVASLNHPNIVAIHDTGAHKGVPYAVTELLQGETLAERMRSGPIAEKRATEIAWQVANALAAAHARGFGHRDVKPENIFLTNDGRAQILDF